MADDVQSPDGDQGAAQPTDSGLYNLDSVDPEVREQLTPHLKEIERNVGKKLQEAADLRKGWQPYEELGLRDVDPGSLKQLLEFAQLANDPEQFSQWWKTTGEQMGLIDQLQQGQDDLGLEDVGDDLSAEKIQELIAEQVAEKLSPIEQSIKQQQEAAQEAQANEEITDAFSKLQSDNGPLFEGKDAEQQEEVRSAIARLAYAYSDDSALSAEEMILKGFEDYKSLIGQGEKGLFDQKDKQPPPAEGAGAPSTSPEKITSFDDPRLKQQATERLRKSLSS